MSKFGEFVWTVHRDVSCSFVRGINETQAKCDFVKEAIDCHKDEGFFSYIDFLYCFRGTPYLPMVIGIVWMLLLFLALGCTASSFLCPSLVVISKSLKLSQTVAGVTFMAFGNGAPDIISSIAGVRQGRPSLVIGELFGGAMLVITVVVGVIFIFNRFELIQRPLLRDVIFYLAASYWVFCLFLKEEIRLAHAIGFVSFYVFYIIVAVIGKRIYEKMKKIPVLPILTVQGIDGIVEGQRVTVSTRPPKLKRTASGISLHHHYENALYQFTTSTESCKSAKEYVRSLSRTPSVVETPDPNKLHIPTTSAQGFLFDTSLTQPKETTPLLQAQAVHDNYVIREEDEETEQAVNPGFWKNFLLHICPIDPAEWYQNKWYVKAFDIVSSPIYIALVLTIPVVDSENPRGNWCKCLNVLHCVVGPLFAVLITRQANVYIAPHFPLWSLLLIVGSALAVVVWLTSQHNEAPRYHCLFGYAGFLVSIFWIYGIATEIVSLLKVFGMFFGISDTLLGMSVLAWGNNVGDVITNISVAKQGFPQMAISACFGTPLLVLLIGLGMSFIITFTANGTSVMPLEYTKLVTVLYSCLVVSIAFILISMLISWFRSRRWIGVALLVLYVCFLVTAVSVEVVNMLSR